MGAVYAGGPSRPEQRAESVYHDAFTMGLFDFRQRIEAHMAIIGTITRADSDGDGWQFLLRIACSREIIQQLRNGVPLF